jgi:hypothetical protein
MTIPYAAPTTALRAREEVTKVLRRFGCESIGFMDDFEKHEEPACRIRAGGAASGAHRRQQRLARLDQGADHRLTLHEEVRLSSSRQRRSAKAG